MRKLNVQGLSLEDRVALADTIADRLGFRVADGFFRDSTDAPGILLCKPESGIVYWNAIQETGASYTANEIRGLHD